MLTSLAVILLGGWILGTTLKRIGLPALVGMLLTGIVLGPFACNVIAPGLLGISADLRQLALIIILTRAGLSLNFTDLKRAGRPAILLCFLPAVFEIGGMVLLAPMLLGVTTLEAAIMGSVVAAVSPAVVVPKMLHIMGEGYGAQKAIPQMIMAGASVDDVFVIVLFTAFIGLSQGGGIRLMDFVGIPLSIVTGVAAGFGAGMLLAALFHRTHTNDAVKVLLFLCVSIFLVAAENATSVIPFSGLLAVMGMGAALYWRHPEAAQILSREYGKLWIAAEILLFALVGAAVDIQYAYRAGFAPGLLVLCALMFRMAGVFVSVSGSRLSLKEKLFCMIAYCPKATVQAAIGAIPLSLGLPCGQMVLTVAVLSILITAPLGAMGIERAYRKLLSR